jgi:dienelactone hydrolase
MLHLALALLFAAPQNPPAPATPAVAASALDLPARIVPSAWLTIPELDATGRRPFNASVVFARHLLGADATPPVAGATLRGDLGSEQSWRETAPDAEGRVGADAAWAYTPVVSPAARVMLLALTGASRVYVNGAGFAGDVYGYGFRGVPVALRAGRNDVYVTGIRGAFMLELWTPSERAVVGSWDITRPQLLAGSNEGLHHAGVLVLNATDAPLAVRIGTGGAAAAHDTVFQHGTNPEIVLAPLCVEKLLVEMSTAGPVPKQTGKLSYPLVVNGSEQPFELEIVDPGSPRRVTFVSPVDASVQECSVLPPVEPAQSIVLTLHGAGAAAHAQVTSYSRKQNQLLVAPTNRRPFGFDWQDWGRTNAYEALAAARTALRLGDLPVYLTGHSMGGHGTWHLAANDPDRFVAIAPSAGWVSFDTYGRGVRDGELAATWRAADRSSDTLALARNLALLPAYVLHGEADDNVPASEARRITTALTELGAKPVLHVEPGAGHWWDGARGAGADCVDWPEIFTLFAASKPVTIGAALDFTTVDPAIDSTHGWLEVVQALDSARSLRVRSRLEPASGELALTTENVRALRFRSLPKGWRVRALVLDGQRLELKSWDLTRPFWRGPDGWAIAPADQVFDQQKSPEFSGPFKRVFDRGFLLVYGTAGDEREDAVSLERARCDAEVWWYRGNGHARVLSDREFLAHADPEWIFGLELGAFVPNVVLYGNADTNAAWPSVFGDTAPVSARRGALRASGREWTGDDLAALFVVPRRDAEGRVIALAGAFADSGVRGARLGYVLAPFTSGVGYPDYTVFSARVLTEADGGVLAAGFCDAEWRPDGRGFVRPDARAPAPK